MGTNANAISRANPNTVADALRSIDFGGLLQNGMMQQRRKFNPDASATRPENLATLDVLELPLAGKVSSIVRATVRAGGVTGELTPKAYGVTPATTEIGVAPNGSIVFLAADSITDVDITYIPERGDVLEITLPVVASTGVCAFPQWLKDRGVALLMKADVLTGTVTGRRIILVPGATNPATGNARLAVAKDQVNFTVADAVTRVRLSLLVTASKQLHSVLEATESLI